MAWIEMDETIWDHHKVMKLCAMVNQPDYSVVGRLISLWHFTLRNAWRDANLEPWGDDAIERASRWDGEKGVWIRALRECGLVDGFVVHGWFERAGLLIRDRRRKEVQRRSRTRPGQKVDKARTKVGQSLATVPYPTVPNRTKHNRTKPKDNSKDIAAEQRAAVSGQAVVVPEKTRVIPPQVDFVEKWQRTYEAKTGQPYRATEKDYTLSAKLIRDYGMDTCVQKAVIFAGLCDSASAWFTSDGWSSYTIGKLTSHWNNITPEAKQPTPEEELKAEIRKQEEMRERANALAK